MAEKTPQTYANHGRLVPLYHYVLALLLLANVLYTGYLLFRFFSVGMLIAFGTAVGLLLTAFFARVFALGAQDRVIRLEERMRMQQLLPDDLRPRINDFTTQQLIALRFASDGELPGLARKVIDGNIVEQKTIKEMIQEWRPDYQRV